MTDIPQSPEVEKYAVKLLLRRAARQVSGEVEQGAWRAVLALDLPDGIMEVICCRCEECERQVMLHWLPDWDEAEETMHVWDPHDWHEQGR